MSELTDRMRTCAAHLLARNDMGDHWAAEIVAMSAVDLLIEASNLIEGVDGALKTNATLPPHDLPVEAEVNQALTSVGAFNAADLPVPDRKLSRPVSPKACPQCDSRAHKRVYRDGRRLMLACPVCGNAWAFSSGGVAVSQGKSGAQQ